MTEGERPPAGGKEVPAGKPFEKSFLLEAQNELGEISDEKLRRRIGLLHEAAKSSVLTPDMWRQEYLSIMRDTSEGVYPEEETAGFLTRIAGYLETKVAGPKQEEVLPEAKIDLEPVAKEVAKIRKSLTKSFKEIASRGEAREKDLTQYAESTHSLAEALGHVDPDKERVNWVDLEYRQEFWQRFEPRSWPRFYESLGADERRIWDSRWQLARAAFYKRATAAFPDKYVENQDLALMGKDQMEALFEIPGVRVAVKTYASLLLGIKEDGIAGSIWKCKDQKAFEALREKVRESLPGSLFEGQYKAMLMATGRQDTQETRNFWMKLYRQEADAVAWNLLWVSNFAESVDSRYSYTGERHGEVPGAIVADEFRTIFHPQERAENKWASKHANWGMFGVWGSAQMARIEKEVGEVKKEEWLFTPAKPGDYWKHKVITIDKERRVEVFVPECYPVAVSGSFFEKTPINGESLLEFLMDPANDSLDIPWSEMKADAWVIYMTGQVGKAAKLFSYYYRPEDPLIEMKERQWVTPLNELFVRLFLKAATGEPVAYLKNLTELDPEKLLYKARQGKPIVTRQSYHNLKVWAVYAGKGGVGNPKKSKVTIPTSASDWKVLAARLRGRQLGYLTGNALIGEGLDIN